jgi:hypothetical protein
MLEKGCCCCCSEDNPAVLKEYHHLLGRSHPETLLVCFNCHRKITASQQKLAPKLRSNKVSEDDRRAYMDVTIGAALELFGKYLKERGLKYGNRSTGV